MIKPDFTADKAIFKPNKMNVTVYSDSITPLTDFSDILFSIMLWTNFPPSNIGKGNMLNIPMKNDSIQSQSKNMKISGLQCM